MGFGFSAPSAPSAPSYPAAYQTDINGNPVGAAASQDDFNIGAGLGAPGTLGTGGFVPSPPSPTYQPMFGPIAPVAPAPITQLNYNPMDIGAQEAIAAGNPVVGPSLGQSPRSSLGSGISLSKKTPDEDSVMDMVSPSLPEEVVSPPPKAKPKTAPKKNRLFRGTKSIYRRPSGLSGDF